MQIVISGKKMEVGDSLRSHAEQRIKNEVEKYLDRVTDATVVFSKEAYFITTSITVNTGTHSKIVIRSTGESDDAYTSFNTAADKMEKQLRRYKRKIKNHHKPKMELGDVLAGMKYVLKNEEEVSEDKEHPLIIAERSTDIQKLTVGEAVMRMDLEELPALMFINKGNSRINVVYKRIDGNISWVDPQLAA